MARPRKYGEPLGETISFRIPVSKEPAFEAKWKSSGMERSEFLVRCVLENKTQVLARQKASVDKERMLFLFAKASNNLNQIAHKANEAHALKKVDEALYRAVLGQLASLSSLLKTGLENVD